MPRLHKEFVALATHHDLLRAEIARSAQRTRGIYAAAAETSLKRAGIDTQAFPPVAIGMLMDGLARVISSDKILGLDDGHTEAIALMETLLTRLEPTTS